MYKIRLETSRKFCHVARVYKTDAPMSTRTTTKSASSVTTLYSNLSSHTLVHEAGTVWGATALVAGTTVGAGILALPAVTQVIFMLLSYFNDYDDINAYNDSSGIEDRKDCCGVANQT